MNEDESLPEPMPEPGLPAIEATGLGKRYLLDPRQGAKPVSKSGGWRDRLRRGIGLGEEGRPFWALRDTSFTLGQGERLGIVGRNGAGKSTLLKILSRIVYPTEGEAVVRGRVTSLLEVGTGFNDNLSGRENVFLNAAFHGLGRAEVNERLEEIVAFAEIGEFLDVPVKRYSSGMRARLAFSVAAHLDPDILILDEVLSVGDAAFQQKCLTRMQDLTGGGRTLLFVSHSVDAVRRFCDRAIWLEHGRIAADGPVGDVVEAYLGQASGLRARFEPAVPEPAPAPAEAPPLPPIAAPPLQETAAPEPAGPAPAPPAPPPAATAPSHPPQGNSEEEVVRLLAVRLTDEGGVERPSAAVDEAVIIEVTFRVLAPGLGIEPAIHIRNARREIIFVVAFTDPGHPYGFDEPGRYRTTARIPADLLNTGMHYVTVALVRPDPLVRHVQVDDAVAFHVYEGAEPGTTARGRYGRDFPGAIRPRLAWHSVALDRAEAVPDQTPVAVNG